MFLGSLEHLVRAAPRESALDDTDLPWECEIYTQCSEKSDSAIRMIVKMQRFSDTDVLSQLHLQSQHTDHGLRTGNYVICMRCHLKYFISLPQISSHYISLHIAIATDKAIFPVCLRNGLKFLKDGGNLQQENI